MKKMGTVGWIAFVLVVIGALNWGLVGALEFNLVGTLFGEMEVLIRAVYVLVGLGAIYMVYEVFASKESVSENQNEVQPPQM